MRVIGSSLYRSRLHGPTPDDAPQRKREPAIMLRNVAAPEAVGHRLPMGNHLRYACNLSPDLASIAFCLTSCLPCNTSTCAPTPPPALL